MLCFHISRHPRAAPPDVWCSLPAAVNRFALEISQIEDGEGIPDATALQLFRHLTAAAAAAMSSIQTEQQQEVLNLREHTAALEQAQCQQQQETTMLQQQAAVLQNETVALQQQVQGLQAAVQRLLQGRG